MREAEVLDSLVSKLSNAAQRLYAEVEKKRPTKDLEMLKREYRFTLIETLVKSHRSDPKLGNLLAELTYRQDGSFSYSEYTLSAVLTVTNTWQSVPETIRIWSGRDVLEIIEGEDEVPSKREI
jgi:hypothetical protein